MTPPPGPSTATLLVSCPDRSGLVAALATLLADHGANIRQSQQHSEGDPRMFFQRIHFDTHALDISHQALEDLLVERGLIPPTPTGRALVAQALSRMGALLKRAPTPEGTWGFQLYHDTFRAHLLGSARTRLARETAAQAWVDAAAAC